MNEILRNRLRTARIERNMKQHDVANLLGIKRNMLSDWENGKTEPDIDAFVKLCNIYGIDCGELLADVYVFKREQANFSYAECEHLKKYRALSEDGKAFVDGILIREYISRNNFVTEQTIGR